MCYNFSECPLNVLFRIMAFSCHQEKKKECQLNLQASVKACECEPEFWHLKRWLVQVQAVALMKGFVSSKTQTPAACFPLTLAVLSPLRRPEEAAHSLRTDDEDLQRAVQSLDVPSCPESRFLTVPFLPRLPCSALSCPGGKVPALTVRSGLKA